MGNLRCASLRGHSGSQMTQKEGASTQTHERPSTVLGTSSFLENLWGFLHATSLPTRTETAWLEREGKCEFPASGQLQITHLWFPETWPLSIHFCRGGKKSSWGRSRGREAMETAVWQEGHGLSRPSPLFVTCSSFRFQLRCHLPPNNYVSTLCPPPGTLDSTSIPLKTWYSHHLCRGPHSLYRKLPKS